MSASVQKRTNAAESTTGTGLIRQLLARLARKPLVRFLIAGGLLFAAYGWLKHESADELRTVRISDAARRKFYEANWARYRLWARVSCSLYCFLERRLTRSKAWPNVLRAAPSSA